MKIETEGTHTSTLGMQMGRKQDMSDRENGERWEKGNFSLMLHTQETALAREN